jgi:hypothetical protein
MLADEAFSELARKGLLINGLAGASRDERSGDGCFAADVAEVKAGNATASSRQNAGSTSYYFSPSGCRSRTRLFSRSSTTWV